MSLGKSNSNSKISALFCRENTLRFGIFNQMRNRKIIYYMDNRSHESYFLLFLIIPQNGKKPSLLANISDNLVTFFHIGPLHQGIGSLAGLIVLYILTGHYYNKWLQHWGGGIDLQTRCGLIAVDLSLNLVFGLYYMNHRETAMGALMMSCPIAISPLIFVVELAAVIVYRRYISGERPISKKK